MPSTEIRPYSDGDEAAVLLLLAASLDKTVDDRYRAFFRWKHLENPFGRSFMWVSVDDGRIVGFRAFLRWRFEGHGAPVEAARAVDTVTDPAHRGAGIFRKLTLHGVGEMREAGIGFIFNTPNAQSRPGYLKMGWEAVGNVPVQVRLGRRRLRSARAILGARTAASPWSSPSTGGIVPVEEGQLDAVLAARSRDGRLATAWTPDALRWRTSGFGPTAYELFQPDGSGPPILFRCRDRGSAVECTVGWACGRARGLADVLGATGADYALGVHGGQRWRGAIPATRLGPTLTFRSLDGRPTPPLASWGLDLLDVELF